MASNRSGKIIKSVKILKSKVVVTFYDSSQLEISKDTYTGFYLFEGKALSNKQISEIEKVDKMNFYLSYALKVLGRGLISEKKLKDKLYEKNATTPIVNDVIKVLKNNDMINDAGFVQDYIEYAEEKLYGELKIKDALIQKGIPYDTVNKVKFSNARELRKAKKLVANLEKSLAKYSYSTRKNKIYNSLLSKGFTTNIALEALLSVKPDSSDKLLNDEINTALKRWMRTNEAKYESDKERFEACYTYLRRKGFAYAKIKQAWGKYYEFND